MAVLGETETFYVRVDGYPGRACDGRGGRGREGVVSDGGRLLLHGRVSVGAGARVPTRGGVHCTGDLTLASTAFLTHPLPVF